MSDRADPTSEKLQAVAGRSNGESGDPADDRAYQTLAEMQDAHDALLNRLHTSEADELDEKRLPSMFGEVRELLEHGSAIGALLDEPRDRRAAQATLDYWASQCYAANLDVRRPTLAAHDPSRMPHLDDAACPFVGLEAFVEQQARYFHGRSAWVTELTRRLSFERLVVVTGASGSGKSSLVLAGLVPALREGAVPGSANWSYPPAIVPGETPLENLLSGLEPWLRESEVPGPDWRAVELAALREDPSKALAKLTTLKQPLLLVVDQFEEALTLRTEENARDFGRYEEALLALIDMSAPAHRLVLTMRSDVESRLAREYPALNLRYGKAAFPVSAMDAVQLREAIEAPARKVGLKFQDGVVDELVRSVVGEEAGLPLLQFTLMALWQRRQGNLITRQAQREVGSPRQAMAAAAEALYDELPDEQRHASDRIFLALGRLDPSAQSAAVFRKRVSRRLLNCVSEPQIVDTVISKFERLRLLRVTRTERASPLDDRIEVAHESLLRNWQRLQRLFVERRDEQQRRAFLHQQAVAWRTAGFNDAFLLNGLALRQAEDEINREPMDALDRDFITKSRELEARQETERLQQTRRRENLLQEQARFAQDQEVQTRLLAQRARRGYLYIVGALVIAALAIWVWADRQTRLIEASSRSKIVEANLTIEASQLRLKAEQDRAGIELEKTKKEAAELLERAKAEAELGRANAEQLMIQADRRAAELRSIASQQEGRHALLKAGTVAAENADESLLWVEKALRADPTLLAETTPVLMQALRYRRAVQEIRGNEFLTVEVVALGSGGKRVLLGDADDLQEWDLSGPQPRRLHKVDPDDKQIDELKHAVYLGDGRVAIAADEGLWMWEEGRLTPVATEVRIRRLRLSDDGSWLGAVSADGGRVHLWRLAPGLAPVRHIDLTMPSNGRGRDLHFLPQGGSLVVLPRDESEGRVAALLVFDREGDRFSTQGRPLETTACPQGVTPTLAGGAWLGRALAPRLCLRRINEEGRGFFDWRQIPLEGPVDRALLTGDGRFAILMPPRTSEAQVVDLKEGTTYQLQGRFGLSTDQADALLSIDGSTLTVATYGSDDRLRIYRLAGGMGAVTESGRARWISDDDRVFVVRSGMTADLESSLQARSVSDGKLLRHIRGEDQGLGAPSWISLLSGAPRQDDQYVLGAQGRYLHSAARCNDNRSRCIVSYDLADAQAPPHEQTYTRLHGRAGELYSFTADGEWRVYAADLRKVVWKVPAPATTPSSRDDRPPRLVLGGPRRFMFQRAEQDRIVVDVFDVLATGELNRVVTISRPATENARFELHGQGRALVMRGVKVSALWDLERPRAANEPLWHEPVVWSDVFVNGDTARVGVRTGKGEDWSLRNLDQVEWRGRLHSDFKIDATGRIAWSNEPAGLDVRELTAPTVVRVSRPREGADDVSLNSRGNVLTVRRKSSDTASYFEFPQGKLMIKESLLQGQLRSRISGAGGYLLNVQSGQLRSARAEDLLAAARKDASLRDVGADVRCRVEERACPRSLEGR